MHNWLKEKWRGKEERKQILSKKKKKKNYIQRLVNFFLSTSKKRKIDKMKPSIRDQNKIIIIIITEVQSKILLI